MKVIKYGASWCSSCKQQDKEFTRHPLTADFESVDVDELLDSEIRELNIKNLPVIIVYNNSGEEIKRWVGITYTSTIDNFLNSTE